MYVPGIFSLQKQTFKKKSFLTVNPSTCPCLLVVQVEWLLGHPVDIYIK